MSATSALRSAFLATGAMAALAGPAFAVAPSRTFVASTGSDANATLGCSRSAPCRGFQAAIDAVAAGGEVVALDSAGYGPMTIAKSVTVTAEGAHAAITAPGPGPAVWVQEAAAAVTLRNLRLSNSDASEHGVLAQGDGTVVLENVVASGFLAAGAAFEGTVATVRGSVFRENVDGIRVTDSVLTVEDSRMDRSEVGLRAENGALVTVRNSVAWGGQVGFRASRTTGPNATRLKLEGCLAAFNFVAIVVDGTAEARVADTRITQNSIGLGVSASAALVSFGDNRLSGNGTNGAFTATLAKQ